MEYPAITICNQGWIDQVIWGAMLRQYRDFAKKEGFKNSGSLQFDQDLKLENLWLQRLYPGIQHKPMDLVKSLASSNPEKHAKSDALANKGKKSQCSINPDCGPGWYSFDIEPSQASKMPKAKFCLKNYGFSNFTDDKCLQVGASRLFQTDYRDGALGAGVTGTKFDREIRKFLGSSKGNVIPTKIIDPLKVCVRFFSKKVHCFYVKVIFLHKYDLCTCKTEDTVHVI